MIEARSVHVCSGLSARASCRSRAQRVSRACPDSRTELIRHAWNVGLRPKGKLLFSVFAKVLKLNHLNCRHRFQVFSVRRRYRCHHVVPA